ncbi:MAG: hypothetical protein GY830_01365 [Bacteroidetes bacterium]|nr:hypothetical protein [Bacteroidota bacterium]
MLLRDIISVKGTNGLFKLLKVTRGGLLLETLDEEKKKAVKNINFSKATPLDNIAVYTKSETVAIPLIDIFKKINKNKDPKTIDSKTPIDQIKDYMKSVLSDYDENKLHPSQILKIISWYKIIKKYSPEILKEKEKTTKDKTEEKDKENKTEKIEELEIKEKNELSKKFSHPKEKVNEINNKVSPKNLIKTPVEKDNDKSEK